MKDLEGVASTFLHERYKDTIARYNQRIAAQSALNDPLNTEKYKEYVGSALEFEESAVIMAKQKNNTGDLPLFDSLVNELKRMKIEGPQYFKVNKLL